MKGCVGMTLAILMNEGKVVTTLERREVNGVWIVQRKKRRRLW